MHAQVDGAILDGAGMVRQMNSGRCGALVMASTAARKVSSPERIRWTDTQGDYPCGEHVSGRRAEGPGTGPAGQRELSPSAAASSLWTRLMELMQ